MKQTLHSLWGKCSVVLLCASLFYSSSFAQMSAGPYLEAGITVGPSNFLGDLGGNYGKGSPFLKDNNIQMTKFMAGAYIAGYPSEWLGVRFALNIGSIEGDDAIIKGKGGLEEARRLRNLNFKSGIKEAFLGIEIYPTTFFEGDPTDVFHKFRPYGMIGVGAFTFNPKGKDPLTGEWVKLHELHTEGQGFAEFPDRKNYSLVQMNIPMGFGVKYFISETVNLSFEIVHRKTFTDYIDDVSTTYIDPSLFYAYMPAAQAAIADRIYNKSALRYLSSGYSPGDKRGTAENNDAYYSAGFKLGIRLGSGTDRRWRNSTRCPIIRF